MLEEEIINCCKRLKLSRNLADMAQILEGESHQEYLFKLLSAELKNREQGRIATLVNGAGFYSIKTFDGFRFDEITLPSGLTPEKLKNLDFIRKRKYYHVWQNGTSKPCFPLLWCGCSNRSSVRFIVLPRWSTSFQSLRRLGYWERC